MHKKKKQKPLQTRKQRNEQYQRNNLIRELKSTEDTPVRKLCCLPLSGESVLHGGSRTGVKVYSKPEREWGVGQGEACCFELRALPWVLWTSLSSVRSWPAMLWRSKSRSRPSLDFHREEVVLAGKVVAGTSAELLGAEGSGLVLLNLPFLLPTF